MNEMENMELEAETLATIINEAIEQVEQAPALNLEEALESLRELWRISKHKLGDSFFYIGMILLFLHVLSELQVKNIIAKYE